MRLCTASDKAIRGNGREGATAATEAEKQIPHPATNVLERARGFGMTGRRRGREQDWTGAASIATTREQSWRGDVSHFAYDFRRPQFLHRWVSTGKAPCVLTPPIHFSTTGPLTHICCKGPAPVMSGRKPSSISPPHSEQRVGSDCIGSLLGRRSYRVTLGEGHVGGNGDEVVCSVATEKKSRSLTPVKGRSAIRCNSDKSDGPSNFYVYY